MTLGDLLARAALRRPEAEAVVDGRQNFRLAADELRCSLYVRNNGTPEGSADAMALREGWYFTDDMGWLDADGDLRVAGRVDDMIISGGETIHPVEVEERVVAFVVPVADLTAEALDQHCRTSGALAHFKRPRRDVFVTEIPRTAASGKILRRLLRDGRYTEVRP